MKTILCASSLFAAALAAMLLAGDDQNRARSGKKQQREPKVLAKPEAFITLVNPDCSHCVDEARRRAGDLRDDDRVLAWIRGKYEGGGIPYRFFLAPYRVISDTYGVFVFDPDAGFVRGYEPSLDFTFYGWRQGVMVIRHKDGTLFSALSGLAFDGPRKGERLVPIPTLETDWGYWHKAYPGSVAYHMYDKYQPLELPGEPSADAASTRAPIDDRLPAEAPVIGLSLGEQAKAYPLEAVEKAGGLLADKLGGQPVVVFWYPATRAAAIYAPQIESQDSPASLTFALDHNSASAPFIDQETKSHWTIEGRAIDGPSRGKTLRWLPGVQCRWFAWAAEYPETELHTAVAAEERAAAPSSGRQTVHGVIVEPAALGRESAQQLAREGAGAVALILDERFGAETFQRAADAAADASLDLYYWIEVARNPQLADEHPEWMASLGLHNDWQRQSPDVALPKEGQVAKAYPWVPIAYREAFEAHLERIRKLLPKAAGDYRGLLLNDLQGGPASCGCGNLQCRWAIDYGVPATAKPLEDAGIAARFVAEVGQLAAGKQVVPVWMTECEDQDLPANLRPGRRTTGYCGSVPCAKGTCPKAFTAQWSALVRGGEGPIGVLAMHKELARDGDEYDRPAGWLRDVIEYLDRVPAREGGAAIDRGRLWLVVQADDMSSDAESAVRRAAEPFEPGAVFVARAAIEQSYEPRIIAIREQN